MAKNTDARSRQKPLLIAWARLQKARRPLTRGTPAP